MLLGFAPWMFLVMHGFNLIYQFWIHTKFIGKLGPLELTVNEKETVSVPMWLGIGAIVAGAALLALGGKKG